MDDSTTPPFVGAGPEDEIVESSAGAADVAESIVCWRCGKSIPVTNATCPVCRAVARHALPLARSEPAFAPFKDAETPRPEVAAQGSPDDLEPSGTPPSLQVIYFFLAFLCVSIAQGLVGFIIGLSNHELDNNDKLRDLVIGAEIVDSLMVLAALVCIARPPRPPAMSLPRRLVGCAAGTALVGGALLANFGYHALLEHYLDAPEWLRRDEICDTAPWYWLVLAICVQPAVFEELFFRYLMLGHFRGVMTTHGAVWVSSLIFGMAHLGVPLSMPILMVVGVALGYARVWSGSLILPMLLHGAHNAAVIYFETHR